MYTRRKRYWQQYVFPLYWLIVFSLVVLVLSGLSGCSSSDQNASSKNNLTSPPATPSLEIVLTYGSEKEAWIQDVTQRFNQQQPHLSNQQTFKVTALPMGSGESINEILEGKRQPHLISPASNIFITLGNSESKLKTGKELVQHTENLVLSPVVIAMWQPMAEAIGWGKKPIGWADIIELAKNPKGWEAHGFPQWGQFKFGHTHPDYSNSGLSTLIAETYAGAGKIAELTLADVQQPNTADYVHAIEQSIVHYGRSTGFFANKMMQNGPDYLSAAVMYENMVIESYQQQPPPEFPIVAIYPEEGTFWSDHPIGIVERDWVTPAHREATQIYIDYLLAEAQQQKALEYGFRPGNINVALAAPIDLAHGVDPQQPKTTLPVPAADVIYAIKKLWHEQKRHANVVMVLDISGSMQGEKIQNLRVGAQQMLDILGEEDHFSLLPFHTDPIWALRNAPVSQYREKARELVKSLFAGGNTALYSAINIAYAEVSQQSKQNIAAIVVLSDGDDTASQITLPELLKKIHFDAESKPIRVFTIGYGSGANQNILSEIANTTQAKFYPGTPQNIDAVFREISTFF